MRLEMERARKKHLFFASCSHWLLLLKWSITKPVFTGMSIRGRKATVSRSTARIDLLSFERNDAEFKFLKKPD